MGIYNWLKDKYGGRGEDETGKHSSDEADFIEDLSYGEYCNLIEYYSTRRRDYLFDIAEGIRLNKKISEWEKEQLWDLIDKKIMEVERHGGK